MKVRKGDYYMRNIENINQNWRFYKGVKEITPELEG